MNEEEFAKTTAVVKEFGTNPDLGPKLQTLLENRASQKENWVCPPERSLFHSIVLYMNISNRILMFYIILCFICFAKLADWWLSAAYLGYRYPVIVHSSPGLIFPFVDTTTKEQQFNYAARLIHAALKFKQCIDNGDIKSEFMGKIPLDMSQYNRIFGVNRAPAVPEDSLSFHSKSRHIVVAYKNFFHKLQVIDDQGKIASHEEILKQIMNVSALCSGLNGVPFGVLTGEPRDSWAKTYERLLRDNTNKDSIKIIEESLFLVCIDRPNRPVNVHKTRVVHNIPEVEDLEHTERMTAAGFQMVHGKLNSAHYNPNLYKVL